MTAADVLAEATRCGVHLAARRNAIIAKPRSALTPEIAEAIRRHRAELLAALALAQPPPTVACWSCHGVWFFARPERLTWICARCHSPVEPDAMVWHEVAAKVCNA